MNSALLFGQATANPARIGATAAAVVCVVAIIATLITRKKKSRIATISLAVIAGVVTIGCALALPELRGPLTRAGTSARPWLIDPRVWGVVLSAIGLYLMLPRGSYRARMAGYVFGLAGLAAFAAALPLSLELTDRITFRILTLITVGSAAACVAMRSAVYSAIWFALSLIGVAGLFFFQGAQFLAVATIVVYAGAIVVTFLFVIMLAQPEGHASYDRITWGQLAKLSSVATSAVFVAVLTFVLFRGQPTDIRWQVARALPMITSEDGRRLLRDDELVSARITNPGEERARLEIEMRNALPEEVGWNKAATVVDLQQQLQQALPTALKEINPYLEIEDVTLRYARGGRDVLDPQHTAHLGRELFSHHLISVEIAGTVLLAALVGAVAIVSHGNPQRRPEQEAQP